MKPLELWHWRYYDPVRKKHCTSRFVCTEADAAEHWPDGAEKVGEPDVRQVPETDAEIEASSTSAFQRAFQREPKTSTGNPSCSVCLGTGWVCEDHRDKPWEHDGCVGSGASCVCNPKGAVEFVEVFAEVEPRPSDGPLQ